MIVKLSEIAEYSKGQQINGDELITNGEFDYLNGGINPSGKWNDSNVCGNTVTISEGGNSSGYVNYMEKPFWCGAHCYYLYNVKGNSKYLYYALKSQQDRIMGLRSGACMPNIKKSDLGKFELIYSFDDKEQTRITAVLDKVTDLIAKHKRQLELLDELVKARFAEMFGDVIQNNKNWEKSFFSDIATSRLGKMLNSSKNTGKNRFPYLANFNVQWFRFDVEKLNRMDFNEAEQAEFELLDGDLLVCEGGEIGRCAVWHNQVKNCFFQKAIHRVRCDSQKILPEYLMHWFKYNCDHKGFAAIEGAKATISHLPSIKLKALIVTVPPLKLQQQFADFVGQTDKSKAQVQKSLEQLETLKKALMQEYFG